MAKWSGLAPAVDAHIHRWSKVSKEWQAMQRMRQRDPDLRTASVPEDQFPIALMWSVFARSWGLPTDNGIVVPDKITEGASINGREQFVASKASDSNGFSLMGKESEMLNNAETVYVSEEIVDRLALATHTIDPEPLFPTDLFAPSGLLVLERPIYLPDYHPGTGELTDYLHVAVRAIGWAPEKIADMAGVEQEHPDEWTGEMRDGILLFCYTTQNDWRDSYGTDLHRALRQGKLTNDDANWDPEIESLDEFIYQLRYGTPAIGFNTLTPMDVMAWSFGSPWTTHASTNYSPGEVDWTVGYVRRFFLTLMRFTWQRLVVPERPQPSAKLAKKLAMIRRPKTEFSVLRLRRVVDGRSEETGTGHRLTWRSRTRGHWRRVHVRSLGPARNEDGSFNHQSHRLKWIEPFWRGPLGAPLGPQHKATVIVR